MSEVKKLSFYDKDDPAAYYMVVMDDGSRALLRRHGDLDEHLDCLRCRVSRNISFGCQHLEAFKASPHLHYEDE